MHRNWVELKQHPLKPTATVDSIEVLVRRMAQELETTFRLHGDVSGVSLPVQKPANIASNLWRHTCFESFIAIENRLGYHEFNFAPSGEWAAYEFRGYRDGSLMADESLKPPISVRATNSIFELKASVRLDRLSDAHPLAPLRIGLSAVVEARDGFSYWALYHSREAPDFHQRDGFAIRLGPPVF